MESLKECRRFLEAGPWREWGDPAHETDQRKGLPVPPPEKPCPEGAPLVDLVAPDQLTIGTMPLVEAIRRRRSRRKYAEPPLTLEELSFLLWATQGVRETLQHPKGTITYRTVPSGGSRHPFETYLAVRRVEGVEPGLYRYLPLEHQLCLLRQDPRLAETVADACGRQAFVKDAAVVFLWTAIPYRTEWRYTIVSHKVIALDAGHVCQNLYLACEAIGAGTCAIGAYNQDEVDAVLGADGSDELTVYIAPVGKVE